MQQRNSDITKSASDPPYGVRVWVRVAHEGVFGIDPKPDRAVPEQARILELSTGHRATITVEPPLVWLPGVRVCFSLEAFESEAMAEAAGRQFAFSLRYAAVSCNCPLSLENEAGRPWTVFSRPQRPVSQVWAACFNSLPPELLTGQIDALFSKAADLEPEWLISLEIFASARLENSDRAKFVAMVSALEPLVDPLELPPQATALVDKAIKELTESTVICNSHKESLRTRLSDLKKQSIGQSLQQFVGTWLPFDPDAQKVVSRAYGLRSRILHRGAPIEDLDAQCQALETVIRSLYQIRLDAPAKPAKAITDDRQHL